MTRTIEPPTQKRGLAVASRLESTQLRPLVPELAGQREEKEASVWSFERAFERACLDVQAIFRGGHEVKGLLLIGLENDLFVAMPFAWASEAERAWLYDRLSVRYQGQAEYYVHATELAGERVRSEGEGTKAGIVRVVGMSRELTILSRCWRIQADPVPRLVEQEDVPRPAEPLAEVLFDRFRPSDSASERR